MTGCGQFLGVVGRVTCGTRVGQRLVSDPSQPKLANVLENGICYKYRSMARHENSQTTPRRRRYFRVAPSPLNEVKFDLGIVLVVGSLLLLVVARISGDAWTQVAILLAYGLLGMIWIIVRVRLVIGAIERSGVRHGSEQE